MKHNRRNEWFKRILSQIENIEDSKKEKLPLPSRVDRYWMRRHDMIPKDWKCPSCRLTKVKSAQWCPPLCKSCYLAEEGPMPQLTFTPYGTHRIWIPEDRTVMSYAEEFGVSGPTVHRWKDRMEIPIEYGTDGDLVVTHMLVEGIKDVPKALGLSGRNFAEMLSFSRWSSGRLPIDVFKRFSATLSRMLSPLQQAP